MKKLFFTIILFIIVLSSLFCEEFVSVTDGRQLLLKSDGTYEFIDNEGYVTIVLTESNDEKYSWGDEFLVLTFRVENNSYGTIYYLKAPITAYDDRGDQIDNYAMSSLSTKDWDTVYIDKGASRELEVKFKGKREYLKEVILGDIKPEYFNMRKLPEAIKIQDLIICRSEIEGINFH